MADKIQISMRIDKELIEKVDQWRDGVDRGLVITRLLEGLLEGRFKIELVGIKRER